MGQAPDRIIPDTIDQELFGFVKTMAVALAEPVPPSTLLRCAPCPLQSGLDNDGSGSFGGAAPLGMDKALIVAPSLPQQPRQKRKYFWLGKNVHLAFDVQKIGADGGTTLNRSYRFGAPTNSLAKSFSLLEN